MLFKQIDEDGLHELVEVVISDNASSDNTEAVVSEFIQMNRYQITYHRQPENLGVIKNILKLVELTKAKYWMFYGDDDIVPPGFLKQVITKFETNARFAAFMFKWPEAYDAYCKQLKHDTEISYEELARSFFYYIGNAGIYAVETQKAKHIVKNAGKYLTETCWPQTLIVFAAIDLSEERCIKFINLVSALPPDEPIVINNGYYLFETTIFALIRTAIYLENVTGKPFVAHAWHSIYGIQHYAMIKALILERYMYFDKPKQRKDLEESLIKAMKDIPENYRREIKDLYRSIFRPRMMLYLDVYLEYFKKTKWADLQTGFLNKLKILSPLGFNAMINYKRDQYAKVTAQAKKTEVDSNSGYF